MRNETSNQRAASSLCDQCHRNVAPFKVGNLPFHNAKFLNRCAECNVRREAEVRGILALGHSEQTQPAA